MTARPMIFAMLCRVRYLLNAALTLSLSLWLGGQVALVLLIMTLFRRDRHTAVRAGPHLFHVFERYQLILAAIAIITSVALFLLTRRRIHLILITCFALAALGGIISLTTVTARMEALWTEGRSDSPAFVDLHRQSRRLYTGEMLLLLLGIALLPAAFTAPTIPSATPTRTASPPASPAARDSS